MFDLDFLFLVWFGFWEILGHFVDCKSSKMSLWDISCRPRWSRDVWSWAEVDDVSSRKLSFQQTSTRNFKPSLASGHFQPSNHRVSAKTAVAQVSSSFTPSQLGFLSQKCHALPWTLSCDPAGSLSDGWIFESRSPLEFGFFLNYVEYWFSFKVYY